MAVIIDRDDGINSPSFQENYGHLPLMRDEYPTFSEKSSNSRRQVTMRAFDTVFYSLAERIEPYKDDIELGEAILTVTALAVFTLANTPLVVVGVIGVTVAGLFTIINSGLHGDPNKDTA